MIQEINKNKSKNNLLCQKNIDPEEITKFDNIAHQWWDINGQFKSLHRINPLRLNYINKKTNGLFKKKVLDVGCGGGILAESMAYEGAIVVGLDMSANILKIARQHALESGLIIDYYQDTIEGHAKIYKDTYDIITCMEVLEHVPNPISVIHACSQLVKPGGDVFFSTLNRNIKAWILAIICAEYILHILPHGTHDINKFIKPDELLSWTNDNNLLKQHIIGLNYNVIRDYFYLSNKININYILHTRRQL